MTFATFQALFPLKKYPFLAADKRQYAIKVQEESALAAWLPRYYKIVGNMNDIMRLIVAEDRIMCLRWWSETSMQVHIFVI